MATANPDVAHVAWPVSRATANPDVAHVAWSVSVATANPDVAHVAWSVSMATANPDVYYCRYDLLFLLLFVRSLLLFIKCTKGCTVQIFIDDVKYVK